MTNFLVFTQYGTWKEIGKYTSRVRAEDAAADYFNEYGKPVQVVEENSVEHRKLVAQ